MASFGSQVASTRIISRKSRIRHSSVSRGWSKIGISWSCAGFRMKLKASQNVGTGLLPRQWKKMCGGITAKWAGINSTARSPKSMQCPRSALK